MNAPFFSPCLRFVGISLDIPHGCVHNRVNYYFQSIHQIENALQGYCMVYQQISAQTRSLHTDQNPISTISAPRLRPNPTTMAAQPHHFDASSERTFASTLRLHRLNQNLSLAVLAERVGCAKSYLSSIENGHKGPPADAIIEKLELALSFQFGELFECAQWDQTPMPIREDLEHLRERDETVSLLAKLLAQSAREGESLDKLYESGELRQLIDRIDPDQVSESVSQEGEDLKSPANRIDSDRVTQD